MNTLSMAILAAMPRVSAAPVMPAARNADLRAQLEADPQRSLPTTGRIVGTAEARSFTRGNGSAQPGAYHSGLQIDALLEVDAHPRLVANLRARYLSPSYSAGMTAPVGLQLWPALTAELGAPGQARLRGGDQGLSTVGAGLYVQDQEGLGAGLESRLGPVHTQLLWTGTGLFNLKGDWRSAAVDLWDGAIGATAGSIGAGLNPLDEPFLTVFSARWLTPWLQPQAELGQWAGRRSGMVGLALALPEDRADAPARLAGGLRLQARAYAPDQRRTETFPIAHDTHNLLQEQRDFVRMDNLLALGDGVRLAAARAWARLSPWRGLFLRGDLEWVEADWAPIATSAYGTPTTATSWSLPPPTRFVFYRADLGGCFSPPDNLCALLVAQNRSSTAPELASEPALDNDTLIVDRRTLGVEFLARF